MDYKTALEELLENTERRFSEQINNLRHKDPENIESLLSDPFLNFHSQEIDLIKNILRTENWEIKEHLGVINVNQVTGWTRELNMISWNGRDEEYDIREWNQDHQHMSPGVIFSRKEILKLAELIEI